MNPSVLREYLPIHGTASGGAKETDKDRGVL